MVSSGLSEDCPAWQEDPGPQSARSVSVESQYLPLHSQRILNARDCGSSGLQCARSLIPSWIFVCEKLSETYFQEVFERINTGERLIKNA